LDHTHFQESDLVVPDATFMDELPLTEFVFKTSGRWDISGPEASEAFSWIYTQEISARKFIRSLLSIEWSKYVYL
jgi:hypothetical protein